MKRTKKRCDKCNKEISLSNFERHYNSCKLENNRLEIKEEWKQENGLYECPYCKKEYTKMGICAHIIFKHIKKQKSNFVTYNQKVRNGEIKHWAKGLTKETSDIIKNRALTLVENIENGDVIPHFKGKHHTEEKRLQIKNSMKTAFKEGRIKGWKSRKIKSYAENYFIEVIKNLKLFDKCEIEHIIKHENTSNYFLDFYFPEKKINLEIDGAQHKFLDRKESDEKRDFFLNSLGIKVFRIEWKNPNTKIGKEYLKNKINEFLKFYNSVG
jgi:very-short-patch-repair endonuclease